MDWGMTIWNLIYICTHYSRLFSEAFCAINLHFALRLRVFLVLVFDAIPDAICLQLSLCTSVLSCDWLRSLIHVVICASAD